MKKILNIIFLSLGVLVLFFFNIVEYNKHLQKIPQKNFREFKIKNFKNKWDSTDVKVAIHEAGHTLFVILYELIYRNQKQNPFFIQLKRVSFVAEGGVTSVEQNVKALEIWYEKNNEEDTNLHQWKYWFLMILLGGYLSEKMFLKTPGERKDEGETTIEELKKPNPKTCDSIFRTFSCEDDYRKIIQKKEKIIKYSNYQKTNSNTSLKQIIEEGEKIISQPRYVRFILLLSQALMILVKVERKDILYIFNHNKLPIKAIQKLKKSEYIPIFDSKTNKLSREYNWKKINELQNKVDESIEKNNLLNQLKKKVLNKDAIDQTIKIKNQNYDFIYLGKERDSSLNGLSHKSIKELNFLKQKLQRQEVKLSQITNQINKILKKDEENALLFTLIPSALILIIVAITFYLMEKRKRKIPKKEVIFDSKET